MKNMIVIESYNDPLFPEWEDRFYNNFNPDDWDFILIHKSKAKVEATAAKLHPHACHVSMKKVDNVWMAVTYHS